ncbi:uncharacterized protein B0T15DRAFT_535745 [Chaetomium strumarium]|uniref:Uncharacterized protein n=1 Tax=Chaetomium strumarium TaxID=1170767 RepID=A0AAJ0GQS3_9PEZI|nr:hypothetical protein B0T15DRAFT_535745 [Chaetomium strumarium]
MPDTGDEAGDTPMTETPAANNAVHESGGHLPEEASYAQHNDQETEQQSDQSLQEQSPQESTERQRPALLVETLLSQDGQQSDPGASTTSPLPAEFPKKRRGRPPGRPNATVREADYEGNPLVQAWNAAKGERAVPVVSICIRAALTEQSLVHETQRAIFRLPSREIIYFVQGWITSKHIASQRPSYVNGLLIHSRGQDAPVSCVQCNEKRAKHALGPFVTCRVLPGSYHNSCSNCKWFDNTSSCSLYTGPKPNRKRKAKEQLPPPPADGVGPPPNDGDTHGSPAGVPSAQGSYSYVPSAHSQPNTDASRPELAEVPSQPDSLAESHYDSDYVAAQLAAQLQ